MSRHDRRVMRRPRRAARFVAFLGECGTTLRSSIVRPSLVFCLALLHCAGALCANLPAPTGWHAESFRFPLAFAPSIPYEGTQSVRLAPSFARFATPQGFSHVLLWDIKPQPLEGAQ